MRAVSNGSQKSSCLICFQFKIIVEMLVLMACFCLRSIVNMEGNMERKLIQTLVISFMCLGHPKMCQVPNLKANGHLSQHPAPCLVDQVCESDSDGFIQIFAAILMPLRKSNVVSQCANPA